MTTAFKIVPIGLVWESKTNPRRHFSEQGMQDLIESVKGSGILCPLIVVGDDDGFEIVAGARRYRAAKASGLTDVPVIVREMTKAQILEAQVVENLQREDVHPLDEAKGYEALMKVAKYDVEKVAASVGRSTKYIYDRVKLLALTNQAQELFWSGMITAGHAILLARLSPADQTRAIGTPVQEYADGGLFHPEHALYHPDDKGDERAAPAVKPVSVRELQGWIDQHVRFDHRKAEPMLFPETVQTVVDATNVGEKIIPITHNYHVDPDAKDGTTRTYGPTSWKRADGEHDTKPCEHSVTGVIVVGPGRGEAFKVCIDKQKCLVHYGKEIRERQKREKEKQSGTPEKAAAAPKKEDWRAKQEAEQKRQEMKREQWKAALPEIMKAIAASVQKAPITASSLLSDIIIKRCRGWQDRKIEHLELVPPGKSAEDLLRHAAFLTLAIEADEWNGWDHFPKRMKAFGLDPKQFLKAVKAEAPVDKKKGKGKAA